MNTQGFNEPTNASELELSSGEMLVAEVLVETHPVLPGRILVTGRDASGRAFEDWLPCLAGVSPHAKDTVLVQRPANVAEPLVTGIVESSQQNTQATKASQSLTVAQNESLRINDHTGQPLVDIVSGEDGPSLQLHRSIAELDVSGRLKLSADALEIKARQGEIKLSASGDIKVDGEMIKLN